MREEEHQGEEWSQQAPHRLDIDLPTVRGSASPMQSFRVSQDSSTLGILHDAMHSKRQGVEEKRFCPPAPSLRTKVLTRRCWF